MRGRTVLLAWALCLGSALSGPSPAMAEDQGGWSERVQLLYQPDTRSVTRTRLRIWDPEPARNLDFVWEPAEAGTVAADGAVSGRGKLTWRVRGSASYDPRAVYATYQGTMRDGRPDGEGRLAYRSGEVLEGRFVRGLLEGRGKRLDADGNRYEGEFRAGLADGTGRLAQRNGDIYVGPFARGKKHGEGETRLAGGAVYRSRWIEGRETARPPLPADSTLSGVLKAQSGGDAGKVDIAVSVEPRMTEEAQQNDGVAYQHMVRDEDIAIFPLDDQMNALWNGEAEINAGSAGVFLDRDWEDVPAYVEVDLKTRDGSRVKLDKVELQVAVSETYRKPMLHIVEHLGCTGFRPAFSVENFGWGAVRDLTMSVAFSAPGAGDKRTRSFSRKIGDFDTGIDVALRDVLQEAGVDTGKLDKERFTCPSSDALNVCRAKVLNGGGLGEVADFIWDEDDRMKVAMAAEGAQDGAEDETEATGFSASSGQFFTSAVGTFDYSWADDAGNVYQASEKFDASIPMFYIDSSMQAECGAGFGGNPQAMRFQDVRFKIGRTGYRIDLPVRGNKTISSYVARLKMQSDPGMSSFTQFTVAATFADKSVKSSKPVSFFFIKPRAPNYVPGMVPPADQCYLPQGITGCEEIDPRGYEDGGEEEEGAAQ
jgi:hypothetical protein